MDRRALEDLELMLGLIDGGTASHPQRVRRLDLALKRMEEWQSEHMPTNGTKGGSSSPRESEDRVEERALASQIARDLPLLKRVLAVIGELPAARAAVMRYTEPVSLSKLPKPESTVPGCVSCARSEQKGRVRIGGHFAPVMPEKAEKDGRGMTIRKGCVEAYKLRLCRWCFDVKTTTGALPPVEACHIMHDQGPRAAGLWLARQGKAA